ncbi:MAG: hypothetical protein WCV50_03825 [Patescibacteria group bacterium]|jgi:hypothetical protein
MDNKNKRLILIFIIIFVIVIVLAALVWWQFGKKEPVINNSAANGNKNTEVVVVNTETNTTPVSNVNTGDNDELALTRLANFFVERFGSYSSESDFRNVTDLKIYMTSSMQIWADDFVKVQRAQLDTTVYSSVITKVISTKVSNLNAGQGTVYVTTQRQETLKDKAGDAYYQEIELIFKKQADQWQVNSASWQAKGQIKDSTGSNTNSANLNTAPLNADQLTNILHPSN